MVAFCGGGHGKHVSGPYLRERFIEKIKASIKPRH